MLPAEPEPDDWLLLAPWSIDDDGLVVELCWFASAPLVTLCEPFPTLMPGLTSAPILALELATPTFAFTPTFGFTLSERDTLSFELLFAVPGVVAEVEPDSLGLDEVDEDEELGAPIDLSMFNELEEELGVPLEVSTFVELDDELGAPIDLSMFNELEDELGCEPLAEPLRSRFVVLEELLDGALEAPAPLTLTSVELDELPGLVVVVPFTPLISVCEDDTPGTTAAPGPRSVVVVLVLEPASGTLGMQPAGCVFATSMHLGALDPGTFTV